ncbi:MAG: restriction endonuclease subunit S [Flavobacteriaceae bacterium]|nr:restriction endonuclease subunit S [Flavobacteriaceae bacterium]
MPEIRFPEFVKEWTLEELEQCLDYLQPTPYLVESTDYKDEYDTPVLTAGKSFILGYTNEKEGIFQENLPVIIFDDFTTATQFVDFPFKTKSSAMKILSSKNGNNIKFVYEAIQMINYEVGVHQRHWISIFSKLKIPTPNLQEQQKIASCLSSLDEVIAAHSQKLELLKDHKKGLMQNLFPQEGETVPKYRFKEFEKDGEWVETTVENNCEIKGRIGYRGYTTQDIVGQGEGALVLGGKHIQNQLLELKDPTYLSWDKYYESPEIMVEVGHIIFSQRGTLGDCAIIDREIGPATINPSMVLIKNITCDARFLYYILIGDCIQEEVRKNRSKGAIPMLSQKHIKEFSFLIPKPKEQQKIASCLSSLDASISVQVEQLAQLHLHKKGLMQGLFPKIND